MVPNSHPPIAGLQVLIFYGGTFDPVHDGHLAIARAARDTLDAAIRMMPAADPPHRSPPGATATQRAEMLDLAVVGERDLCVDRRELRREGRSYSIDTLLELRAEHGADAPIALLVGADSFVGLPDWHRWRELFDQAHFVVAERPGSPLDQDLRPELAAALAGRWRASPAALRDAPAGCVFRLRQPLQEESATAIRQRIAAGRAWREMVPVAVAGYIERHGLYLNAEEHAGPPARPPL
ncbi:nicotinate-nucleotide adenylyltransferase [Luteimonas notoginsengisoli]|jgi:nicotinate-nucleotide adenylyltransferase|uniref:Probable nicotinate-nucleotide adenylyltransferase n=1 Tax=Luteimonas notoginsengisoli TaxID=1578200 RepID=A0ABV7UR57_9GAMM